MRHAENMEVIAVGIDCVKKFKMMLKRIFGQEFLTILRKNALKLLKFALTYF